MPTNRLLFQHGDTLALPSGPGETHLYKVERRRRDGYVLSSMAGAPDSLWTHERIYDIYTASQLQHWPCNLASLDQNIAEMLQTDVEGWPERLVFEARCRESYVRYTKRLRDRGMPANLAYIRAAKVVTRTYRKKWAKESQRIAGMEAEAAIGAGRKAKSTHLDALPEPKPFKLGKHGVRKWYQVWEQAGYDLRALIAKYHKRGRHKPRAVSRVHEQEDPNKPLCVYGAMEKIGRTVWMSKLKVTKTYAYKRFRDLCKEINVEPFSRSAFVKFLHKRYSEFEIFRSKHGARLAYLKYNIFERRKLPKRALEEVEVDHCLLDVWVTDKHGRKARPWLTVLICRATKMIVGYHLSFDVPSYTTLSRAIIHAMAPKDLSNFPEIENDWPCHGVFDFLITDRGMEFLSESLNRAGNALRFAIVNLPGRMPHLKGTVERYFATLGIRVLSHMEGTTLSRTEVYDPKAAARFTLEELSCRILKWIVDDYHQTDHSTLGMAPVAKWKELVDDSIDGGVRPVGNFKNLVMLMGEIARRKISNVGIHFENNLYASHELAALRKRHGGLKNWYQILADPVDRGHLWVLDTVEKRWLVVPVANARTAKGLNKFAMKVVMRMARKMVAKGETITDAVMEEARERCDREALTAHTRSALRYMSDGALATPVLGNNNILTVLAGAVMPTPGAYDDDQGELFGEYHEAPAQPAASDEPQASAAHVVRASVKPRSKPKPEPLVADKPKGADNAAPDTTPQQSAAPKGPSALDLLIAHGVSSRKALL